jgi:murein DD-endopeptidase MepM/ murein hydrolase activator NlpD
VTTTAGGRRRADVAVDDAPAAGSAYVGRRRAAVAVEPIGTPVIPVIPVIPVAPVAPVAPATVLVDVRALVETVPSTVHEADHLDTGTIERVLSSLEPVDQTTSFEREDTAPLPMLRAEPPSGGKRRAVKQTGGRGPLFRGFPSGPVLLGIAALAVSIGGVVTVHDPKPASGSGASTATTQAASALGGTSGVGKVTARRPAVTRSDSRDAAQISATGQNPLQAAADATAAKRDDALGQIDKRAEVRGRVIAQNLWIYPLEPVILTARFGQFGLWASYHTGLDFNGETGDQIHAIADGVVIFAQYDGSYGNKTIVRLPDGTELWYCHQSAYEVSVGDTVKQGQVIGLVGATGHVTGSHLHVEVHPGGGDPVDPYPAMQQHGLFLGDEAQPG